MSSGCTGFAVAGGRSRRMGRDKALLPWGHGTLLDHAVARLREVTEEVVLLADRGRGYAPSLRAVPDAAPGAGPLSAVAGALAAEGRPLGLFLGVDLPLVPSALLGELIALCEGWDAAVPVRTAGPEPLCAVYARSCLGPIRRRLEAGERKMTCFWPDVRVRRVGPETLERFGAPDRTFLNVNDREDYERAVREAVASSPW